MMRRWACAALLLLPASSFVLHGRSPAAHPARPRGRAGRAPSTVVMMEEVECDVVIVGGGPAGCTCALYTSGSDLKTVMLDKNPATGALAITSHIANCALCQISTSGAYG